MTQCFSIMWFWAFRETYVDQNVSFKIRFQKFEREAPSTNQMCSKFKEARKVTSMKLARKWRSWNWQESDVHEIGKWRSWQESDVIKKVTLERSKISWIWLVSNKTNAPSSLRTAQAGKSETRQNEKRYYKIQKGFICQ